MLSQNDVERERYQARLKWERDQTAFIDEARDLALTEGRNDGLKQGREEGREEGLKQGVVDRVHLCERLLKSPLTPTEQLLALRLEELQMRAKSLEKQLGVADA